MKSRPIHYTRAMRDARRAGLKTQTRRVIKPQPEPDAVPYHTDGPFAKGMTLYVHEPVDFLFVDGELRTGLLAYLDDGVTRTVNIPDRVKLPRQGRWKGRTIPPEWARERDRITDVRVERVQDISEEDAKAEGVSRMHLDDLGQTWQTYRRGFQALWDSINAKRGFGWDENPWWVWVISFEAEAGEGGGAN